MAAQLVQAAVLVHLLALLALAQLVLQQDVPVRQQQLRQLHLRLRWCRKSERRMAAVLEALL